MGDLGRVAPRVQFLVLAGKARAILYGRYNVSRDMSRNGSPVLRHRILLNFQAESEISRTVDPESGEKFRSMIDSTVPEPKFGLGI